MAKLQPSTSEEFHITLMRLEKLDVPMHNKGRGGHWSREYCQTSCFAGSCLYQLSSTFKHDFHQSFILKRHKYAFHRNIYIRNTFQKPPFSGPCLNTADKYLPTLFVYFLMQSTAKDQELNVVLFNHCPFWVAY